jgi:hypothetical protein
VQCASTTLRIRATISAKNSGPEHRQRRCALRRAHTHTHTHTHAHDQLRADSRSCFLSCTYCDTHTHTHKHTLCNLQRSAAISGTFVFHTVWHCDTHTHTHTRARNVQLSAVSETVLEFCCPTMCQLRFTAVSRSWLVKCILCLCYSGQQLCM